MKFSRYNLYIRHPTHVVLNLRTTSHQIYIVASVNGDGEIRTLDPLLARQVLSQLSYAPMVLYSISSFDEWA